MSVCVGLESNSCRTISNQSDDAIPLLDCGRRQLNSVGLLQAWSDRCSMLGGVKDVATALKASTALLDAAKLVASGCTTAQMQCCHDMLLALQTGDKLLNSSEYILCEALRVRDCLINGTAHQLRGRYRQSREG
eukprot:707788-Amphidinium_carterae.1